MAGNADLVETWQSAVGALAAAPLAVTGVNAVDVHEMAYPPYLLGANDQNLDVSIVGLEIETAE